MARKKIERKEVKPGQIWRDCDKRMSGRHVRVEAVDERFAYCVGWNRFGANSGIKTRIAIERMYPNASGFELVED